MLSGQNTCVVFSHDQFPSGTEVIVLEAQKVKEYDQRNISQAVSDIATGNIQCKRLRVYVVEEE